MKPVLIFLFVVAASCGTPTPSNSNSGGRDTGQNTSGDAGDNTHTANSTIAPTNGGTEACVEIGERFKEAVRALPRACVTDTDCMVVSRAQVCDCDLAVARSSDTVEHDAIRAELDAEQCSNPFGCPTDTCPYRRLSEPGELYARCGEANECEIVQLLPCAEYEARGHGGIVPPGACVAAAGCTLRNDLNPCGCNEAITTNFPALAVQPIREMIEINDRRCNLQCMGCNSPGDAVCGDDGSGNMICMAQ